MQAKVLLEIIKGEKTGERFEFGETSRVLIGRQEDCGIVIPLKTISRYHCLLEIHPHTNIIYLTNYVEYMKQAIYNHCSGYILKPLSRERVRHELANLRFPVRGLDL